MEVKRGIAEVEGTRLYYELAGQGPPLVLVHGFTLDQRVWDPQFEACAERFTVVRYDVRGFGSSSLPGEQSYRHGDDLRGLLDWLGIGRSHVAGFSLGGQIALELALEHPEAVSALVLADSYLADFAFSSGWLEMLGAVTLCAQQQSLEQAKQLWLASELFASARARPHVAAALRRMVDDYSGWHFQDLARTPLLPLRSRLQEVRVPTLVMVGERDIPDFRDIADLLGRSIPGARRCLLRDVGHMSLLEDPAAFNRELLGFLAGQPGANG